MLCREQTRALLGWFKICCWELSPFQVTCKQSIIQTQLNLGGLIWIVNAILRLCESWLNDLCRFHTYIKAGLTGASPTLSRTHCHLSPHTCQTTISPLQVRISSRSGKMDWEWRRRGGLRDRCMSGLTHRVEVSLLPCICLGVVCFSLLALKKHIQHTHTITLHAVFFGGGGASWARCREVGWERHPLALRWIIQPAINYNLASQKQRMGEFLWPGLQLIVFFLPERADVGAERGPSWGTGCLHVWRGSSLVMLHNMKGRSALCRPEQSNV